MLSIYSVITYSTLLFHITFSCDIITFRNAKEKNETISLLQLYKGIVTPIYGDHVLNWIKYHCYVKQNSYINAYLWGFQ